MVTQPTWQDLAIEQSNNPNNPHAYVPPASNPVSNNLANMADAEPGALPSPTAMGIGAPTSGRGSGVSSVPDQQPEFINKIIPGPPAGYKGGRNITEHTEQVPNPLYVKPVAPGAAQAASHQAAQATTPPAEQVSAPPAEQVSAPVVKNSEVPSKQQSMASVVPGATPVKSPLRTNLAEHQDIIADQLKAVDEEKKSVELQARTLKEGNREWYDTTQQAGVDRFIADTDKERKTKEFQIDTDRQNADVSKRMQELRDMKPDPQHWFKEKGTAGSILAAISIAGGAFAAAMPHTANHENVASGIIDKAIDRDTDAQKSDIENKWKELNFQGAEAQRKYVQGQFFLHQMDVKKVEAYDNAIAMASSQLQHTNNEVAAQGLQQTITQLGDKRAGLLGKISDQKLNVYMTEQAQNNAADAANPWSPKNIMKKAASIQLAEQTEFQKNPKARSPRTLGQIANDLEKGGYSGDKSTLDQKPLDQKQQDAVNAANDVIQNNTRIKEILANPVYANSLKGRAELDELARSGQLAYPRMHTGSTRINETELKMANEAYSGAEGLLRSDVFGRTGTTLDTITKKAQGIANGQTGTSVSSGEAVPGAESTWGD